MNSTVLKQTLEAYDPTDPSPSYAENKFRRDPRPVPGIGKKKKGKGKRLEKARKEMREAEEKEKREREESEKQGVQGDVVEVHGEKIDLRDVGQPGADVGGRG